MRSILRVAIALPLLSACDLNSSSSALRDDEEEAHYEAKNCEIFIDKIASYRGSHGSLTLSVYVKLLKNRLDGDVAEVGFRNLPTDVETDGDMQPGEWSNLVLGSRSPVGDYWATPYGINVLSDFGRRTYEGVFYVKTTSGTYYWAKQGDGGNFYFDTGTAVRILAHYPGGSNYESGPDSAIRTQDFGDMHGFNPQRCY